ncbi:MAG: hypothetical protein H0W58_08020 [Acidobacteria bacterium]|nr:hypothetical protein [Acidobacteriota bacterium]
MEVATENSRRIPPEKAASVDEINDAITSLTAEEIKRLEKFARWRIKGLGRKKMGRNWEVLLNEAVVAFCSDTRRWDKERVDFVRAMTQAMRSISDNWRRTFDEDEPRLESEMITTSLYGEESNPLSMVAAPNWNKQKELEAQKDIEIIESLMSKRVLASLIVAGWKDIMTGAEIRKELDISQEDYDKEVKWIRRTVRAAFKERGDA